MAGKVAESLSKSSFDFEIVGGALDEQTAAASTNQSSTWIDPSKIRLRHRIGRGAFGDVWLATLHQETADYEEFHEVAVKALHPVKDDSIHAVLNRLGSLIPKCQGLECVCRTQGVSIISGELCIVMKFYDGSIGDKMARLKGSKLSLNDVLRYGADLAQGIVQVHSKDILLLNLKPCNFLLTENDKAILGDFGTPYVLIGIPLSSLDVTRRLGTPNYMAPEQWQPEVRGPLSFETDSWGFACSIIEMLTGVQPWSGKSVEEIYKCVVKKQEKPHIPRGLPPSVENVISGCFEYDFRCRPLMEDVLHAFRSSQSDVHNDGRRMDSVSRSLTEIPSSNGRGDWFLMKDHLQVGDIVRSRKLLNSCKSENMEIPEGTIVGLDRDSEQNGYVLVRVHGIHDPKRVHKSTLERVTFGLATGDWVRLKAEDTKHSSVGILHSVNRNGSVTVGFIGMETLWTGTYADLQMAETYYLGQFVKLKSSIFNPRFEWPRKRGDEWATGRISQISPNGCLVVTFPGRLTFGGQDSSFLADPAEVEAVSFKTARGVVKKYEHLEDFHWAVRPILIALGLFTAMKLGFFAGRKIGRSKSRKGALQSQGDNSLLEGQQLGNGNAAWLPPKVANYIFREGVPTSGSR